MILGVPMILSSYLPGQEAGNVPFVENGGFGLYAPQPLAIANHVVELLSETGQKRLKEMRRKAISSSRPEATLKIARDIGKIALRSTPQISAELLLEE